MTVIVAPLSQTMLPAMVPLQVAGSDAGAAFMVLFTVPTTDAQVAEREVVQTDEVSVVEDVVAIGQGPSVIRLPVPPAIRPDAMNPTPPRSSDDDVTLTAPPRMQRLDNLPASDVMADPPAADTRPSLTENVVQVEVADKSVAPQMGSAAVVAPAFEQVVAIRDGAIDGQKISPPFLPEIALRMPQVFAPGQEAEVKIAPVQITTATSTTAVSVDEATAQPISEGMTPPLDRGAVRAPVPLPSPPGVSVISPQAAAFAIRLPEVVMRPLQTGIASKAEQHAMPTLSPSPAPTDPTHRLGIRACPTKVESDFGERQARIKKLEPVGRFYQRQTGSRPEVSGMAATLSSAGETSVADTSQPALSGPTPAERAFATRIASNVLLPNAPMPVATTARLMLPVHLPADMARDSDLPPIASAPSVDDLPTSAGTAAINPPASLPDALPANAAADTPPIVFLHMPPPRTPDAIQPTMAVTLSAPVPVTALPQAIASIAKSETDHSVELRLDPIELGNIQLSMRGTEKDIAVVVMVERPETLDLLRKHADQFLADLRQSGYSGTSLTFDLSDQRGQSPRQPPPTPLLDYEPLPPAPQPPPPMTRSSRLDMRL